MTEADPSARIIDLAAYRLKRGQQKADAAAAAPWNAPASPAAPGFALPMLWYWPSWVWVAVPMPTASAVRWDAR